MYATYFEISQKIIKKYINIWPHAQLYIYKLIFYVFVYTCTYEHLHTYTIVWNYFCDIKICVAYKTYILYMSHSNICNLHIQIKYRLVSTQKQTYLYQKENSDILKSFIEENKKIGQLGQMPLGE